MEGKSLGDTEEIRAGGLDGIDLRRLGVETGSK